MIEIKTKQVQCDHNKYCEHRKIHKCQLEQQRIISHSFQPKGTYVLTNHPISRSRQYKSNIKTLAYEKYLRNELQIDEDQMKGEGARNIADYLSIIDITQEMMKPHNAYVLADQQTIDYQMRKKLKQQTINKAKKRAQSELKKKLQEKIAMQYAEKLSEKQFLQKLVKKLNTVADHIILKGGESMGARERQLLQEKSYVNANYLAELKIKDRAAVLGILDDLRVLLLKHKVKNESKRQDIQNQKKLDSSFSRSMSIANSSVVSQAQTVQKQLKKQQQFLNRFINFQVLQKKWMKQNIQQVKDAIRRVLATRILAHAQRQVVRNNKQKKSIDKKIKSDMSGPYLKAIHQLQRKGKINNSLQQGSIEKKFISGSDMWSKGLNPVELRVKSEWIKNNLGSSAGQSLQRELNYTKLFGAKAEECCIKFQMRQSDTETAQCSCECHPQQQKFLKKTRCPNLYD